MSHVVSEPDIYPDINLASRAHGACRVGLAPTPTSTSTVMEYVVDVVLPTSVVMKDFLRTDKGGSEVDMTVTTLRPAVECPVCSYPQSSSSLHSIDLSAPVLTASYHCGAVPMTQQSSCVRKNGVAPFGSVGVDGCCTSSNNGSDVDGAVNDKVLSTAMCRIHVFGAGGVDACV